MPKISVVILCIVCAISCASALPHCEKTEIPQRLLVNRVVNVVYTMESSCKKCLEQASRLPRLKRYLERKGIKTHFIIAVSHRADRLWGLVPKIQVNSRHIWRALGEQNDHFYIIDRCGRLVYEVINPWSNLNFPFVKAAVAATAHNHPCGLCPEDYIPVPQDEEIEEFPALDESSQIIPEGMIPMRLNIKLRHRHAGDPNIYKHIVRVAGLPHYHGHYLSDVESPTESSPTEASTRSSGIRESSIPGLLSRQEITSGTYSSTTPSDSSYLSSPSKEHMQQSTKFSTTATTEMTMTAKSDDYTTEMSSLDYSEDSSSTMNSIKYDSSTISHPEENQNRVNLKTSQLPKNTEDAESTTTEYFKEAYSEPVDESSTDSSASEDYNNEDYQNTEDSAEVRNLKAHYDRIVKWFDFVSDDYDIND